MTLNKGENGRKGLEYAPRFPGEFEKKEQAYRNSLQQAIVFPHLSEKLSLSEESSSDSRALLTCREIQSQPHGPGRKKEDRNAFVFRKLVRQYFPRFTVR